MSKKDNIHLQRMRAIRKHVNFNYSTLKSLTPYAKRKIKLYYDEIMRLTARPYYKYRPRDKKRAKLAYEYAGQHRRTGFKHVFFPAQEQDKKPKMSFKNNTLTVSVKVGKSGKVNKRAFLFDKKLLATNTDKAVDKLLEDAEGYSEFTIMNGEYLLVTSHSRGQLKAKVNELVNEYDNTEQWLRGAIGWDFDLRADLNASRNKVRRERKEILERRAKGRKRIADKKRAMKKKRGR